MSELKEVFTNIYQSWGFGGDESRSGPGSSLDETEQIRNQIRKLVREKNIKTVGAGLMLGNAARLLVEK